MSISENITSLRQVMHIRGLNDLFLYEIMEDYKEAETQEEKDEIFHSFCSSLWSSDNKRRTYTKSVRFHVKKDLLDTDLGQVFDMWSDIEYNYYKAMTQDENWCSILRQKINNIYTRYFDKEVILGKEYMDLLKTPKRLYYEWVSGADMDAETAADRIHEAIDQSTSVKARLQMEKMSLSWKEYKKVVEDILRKAFHHCQLVEAYEGKSELITRLDFLTEDHFYVGYVCRYLDRDILSFQKKYYGVRQHKKYIRCAQCGSMIEKTGNKRRYCNACAKEKERARKREIACRYRVAK